MKPEALIAVTFGLAESEISDDTSPESLEDWDSLAHMNLVLEIEDVYGVDLSADDALEIKDVASLKRVLLARGVSW